MTVGSLLAALLVKPALVVAGAMLLAWILRRQSAAARHAIWAGAVGAVLVLPLLTSVLPPLRIGTLAEAARAPLVRAARTNRPRESDVRLERSHPTGTTNGTRPRASGVQDRLPEALFYVWATVALILVARRFTGELLVRRLVARGGAPPATLAERCAAIARSRGVRQSVTLTLSDETASPAVVGILRPVVILPAAAGGWTDAETTNVLVHELSHVARRDCAMNLIADLTAAIHWCNPMVHVAARRIRAEGERACDDEVLYAGGDPGAYAQLLVAFARAAHLTRTLPRAASAMARPSELESRVTAVLDPRVPRAPLRKSIARALAALSAVLALPIAAATLSAAAVAAAQVTGPEPDRLGDSVAAQSSERVPVALDEDAINAAARRALAGPDSALAAKLVAAVRNAPNDPQSLVRDRAGWALLQTRGDRLMEPVLEALDANDWRVQAYAAWTAGVAGDHRAVPKLIPLVRHPVWRLRAMAASSLRWLADPRAADVMTTALTDQAWQVRMEAVEYLAALDDPSQRERLRARLTDRHVAVRLAAARALNLP